MFDLLVSSFQYPDSHEVSGEHVVTVFRNSSSSGLSTSNGLELLMKGFSVKVRLTK